MTTNLMRRGATYYFRLRVPSDLVGHIGHRELKRSLGTKSLKEAKARVARARTQADILFDNLRRNPMLTNDEITELARDFYQEKVEESREWRSMSDHEARLREAHEAQIDGRASLEQEVIADLRSGRIDLVYPEVDLLLRQMGRSEDVDENSVQFRKLCQLMLRALLEATRRAREEDEGRFDGTPSDPLFKDPPRLSPASAIVPNEVTTSPAKSNIKDRTIISLVDPFIAEKTEKGKISEKTQNDYRASLDLFMQVVGANRPISDVTPDDIVQFKDLLLVCPTNFRKRLGTKSLQEAVRINTDRKAEDRLDTLDSKTINQKYLSNLKTFFDWVKNNKHIKESPASGVRAEQPRRAAAEERDPFSISDLQVIFVQPVFTEYVACQRRFDPGEHHARDHYFWAPLIALFAGCRLSEIGQLVTTDITELHGMPHIVITDAGESQMVKSAAARRWIPVHPTLQELGFLRHVAAVGDGRLFPGWARSADGYYSSSFSKWFSRFLTSANIKTSKKSFHSFRHTFKDALKAARLGRDTQDLFMGHEDGSVQRRYGSGKPILEESQDFLTLTYKGLDLSHLRR